ncbi:extracellular solute-binding protein [Bacillus sp. 03113]|uniref:extracellular solute-binding protein n=1 Tax=Bacillus sp. 03113 TaxID=2578211 RepID=UPI0015E8D737|nr:extracellular solute-binding protein [Bacillus sp. 03113]
MGWRWVSFILILVLLAACRGPSMITDPGKVRSLHNRDKIVITYLNTYNDKETELLEQVLIPAFERENPHIQVESIDLSFNNELKNNLIALASSNRGPDVVRLNLAWVPEFSTKGVLEPLNKFYDFEEIRSRFNPKLMNVGFYNNNYYSLPLNTYSNAAIFNKDLLKSIGYSKPPQTIEEILKIAHQHRFTIGLRGLSSWETIPYLYSLGGALTDRSYKRATGYLNSENTIKAVEQLTSLYKENLLDLPDNKLGAVENWDRVKAGNILMTDDGPWFYALVSETEKKKALKLTIPVSFPHSTRPASIISGENLVIMNGSKRKDEAWTFIKWMTRKESQLTMARVGLMPTNIEAVKAFKVPRDSFLYPYVEDSKNTLLLPPVKNWTKIDEVYTEYMNKIFAEEMSVKDGLDHAAVEIDRLLADSD